MYWTPGERSLFQSLHESSQMNYFLDTSLVFLFSSSSIKSEDPEKPSREEAGE